MNHYLSDNSVGLDSSQSLDTYFSGAVHLEQPMPVLYLFRVFDGIVFGKGACMIVQNAPLPTTQAW